MKGGWEGEEEGMDRHQWVDRCKGERFKEKKKKKGIEKAEVGGGKEELIEKEEVVGAGAGFLCQDV